MKNKLLIWFLVSVFLVANAFAITILEPTDNETIDGDTFNISVSGSGVDTLWYSLDGEANQTFTNNTEIPYNHSYINVPLIVYANDTLGTIDYKTIYISLIYIPSSDWEEDKMEIAIVIVLIGISFILMYFAMNHKDQLLKLLFMGLSFVMMLLGINAGINLDGISTTLQRTLEIGFVVLLFGGLLFFIVYTALLFVKNAFDKKRRFSIGDYDDEED